MQGYGRRHAVMSGKSYLFATAAHSNIEHVENALHFALDN